MRLKVRVDTHSGLLLSRADGAGTGISIPLLRFGLGISEVGGVYREPVAIALYSAFIRASRVTSSVSASEGAMEGSAWCHAYPPEDDDTGGIAPPALLALGVESTGIGRVSLDVVGGTGIGMAVLVLLLKP